MEAAKSAGPKMMVSSRGEAAQIRLQAHEHHVVAPELPLRLRCAQGVPPPVFLSRAQHRRRLAGVRGTRFRSELDRHRDDAMPADVERDERALRDVGSVLRRRWVGLVLVVLREQDGND